MATTQIEKLLVSLEARTKEYEKALARAQGQTVTQLRKIEREAEGFSARFDRKLGAIGASMKAALAGAAVAAVAAFGVAARNAVRDAAAIGNLADKIGVTTDKVQELAYGAVQANLGFEDLNGNLSRFSKLLGEAQNGSGELFKLFEANGFDKQALKAMSFSKALDAVADMIKNARGEQDQMVVATTAFGKSGGDMIAVLRGGAQGLKEYGDAALRANAIIKNELVRSAQIIDNKWAAAMQSLKTTTQSAVLYIIDELVKLNDAISSDNSGMEFLSAGRGGSIRNPNYRPKPPRLFSEGSLGGFNYSSPSGTSPTIIPDADAEQKAAQATLDKAAADREAARAAKERASFIKDVTEVLDQEWQASTKAAIAITDELNAQALEKMRAVEDSMRSLAELGLSAFERMAIGGEKLTDVLSDVARSLASAALQAAVLGQGPLAGFMGGGGGLFGSLFGSIFGNGGLTSLYHKGGIVGSGNGTSRMVNPSAFAGAGRFHGGGFPGLRMGEVPAILQKGEMVLPRGARNSGADLRVVINNYTGEKVTQRKSKDGITQIDIGNMVSSAIVSGKADKAMQKRFGFSNINRRR